MPEILAHEFTIKRITKTSDDDYKKALNIYTATTPNDIKTNSNEITMWLNNFNSNTFELMIFVLYLNNDVIGFAMLSYVLKYKVVIYDYIALKENYRLNAVFYSYVNLIQDYLLQNGYDLSYFVVEISNKNSGTSIDKESMLFKKLICLEGFGKVKAKYQTLPLGLEHHESSFDALLYIKTNDTTRSISKETYIGIVHAIYYEYYLAWYTLILSKEELSEFKNRIDHNYKRIMDQQSTEIQLEIECIACPISGNLPNEKTYGYLPSKQQESIGKYIILVMAIVAIVPLIFWLYSVVLGMLGFSGSPISTIIGAIFSGMMGSVTTFFVSRKKS